MGWREVVGAGILLRIWYGYNPYWDSYYGGGYYPGYYGWGGYPGYWGRPANYKRSGVDSISEDIII
jgi:hypothetical protein